ncbi:MAG: (E)-4-hydroxy-3-methylbut-2-enyl-diphosphate synthase [Bacteroidota bacterium]
MEILKNIKYRPLVHHYERRRTREVAIGDYPVGGNNPIRLQSMTNTRTQNIDETVAQCIRIIEAGGEYVRITAPATKDAELLKDIKDKLVQKGFTHPVIADIHYSPGAAMIAARHVDKIRINPGNFADKKKFDRLEYTDKEYAAEIARIEERFVPLIETCKEHKTAMRIGVNHGSLSDRIMGRYGDTPYGMAESAMEFLRICKKHDYLEVVVSMKASNTLVMVQANRILATLMDDEDLALPIHLGVTEAGEGEDGRIKSAIGTGSLLADGIGDTIRVSLTEAPEKEIPVARKIVQHIEKIKNHTPLPTTDTIPVNPFEYARRQSRLVENIGGDNPPVVIGTFDNNHDKKNEMHRLGFKWRDASQEYSTTDHSPEYLFVSEEIPEISLPDNCRWIVPQKVWIEKYKNKQAVVPLFSSDEFLKTNKPPVKKTFFITTKLQDINEVFVNKIQESKQAVLVMETINNNSLAEYRRAVFELMNKGCTVPVVFKKTYREEDSENFQLMAAIDAGPLFLDGLGDGLWIENEHPHARKNEISTAFSILQASRVRITKPEYISCPGCGRTLFNLEDTVAKIKARTGHLKGLKIGVMGCIVNGIGEMADADYGYVGAGPGKITLYRNKEVVKKNLPEEAAVDELVKLIEEYGDWKEQTDNLT